ncbi:hypothetical protein PPERSA_06255 [Pseudocohnilembus persalinus]|uniref:Uncharacterized protein n=1 Tax=Pseudocohnilembus persalinus TaxID=266149 RepID=A0A0V0QVA1_PSEPJ|nr:hypothetical protein PPERSA_06255 [Pseudocohnilembus persalinus]|eukprot:KRX06284.1 hypothetical protein PPERSA_06255 [Pseudocohnilembus persalinus]
MENKKPFENIMVATDGSERAKMAFWLALTFYDKTELFDQIIVAHVSDKSKTYLPDLWKPEFIYNEYKTSLLTRFPSDKYKLCFEEKRNNVESCRDQILQMAQSMKVSFLFIGFTGRKGDKQNQTVLSQTVKHSAFHSSVPLVIVKELSERKNMQTKGFTFLACVDGSQKSYTAMKRVFNLASDEHDKIVVCYAPLRDKQGYANTIKAEVQEQLKDQPKKKWTFTFLKPSFKPDQAICKYINDAEEHWINFVVIGNNGYRAMVEKKSFFGTYAETILINANANIIVVSQ